MIKKFSILAFSAITMFVAAQRATHTVAKGDNPYNIAKKYGMTLDELVKLNPAAKDGKLNIGDKLVVKGLVKSSTTKPATNNQPAVLGQIIVQPKQTVYGITKQYRVSEADLRKWNPDLDNNMKIGSRISLPESAIKKYGKGAEVAPVEEKPKSAVVESIAPSSQNTYANTGTSKDDYLTYTVESGDTTFGIVNKFGITLDNLIELNPEISSGLKPGTVLKIKKLEPGYAKKSEDVLNVVFMLPFGYDSDDSRYRTMSLDFLSGAKLAIERNARLGQKLNIKVVDAGNEVSFKNSITQINRDNTDLIIGPFFKSNVIEVLDYVKSNEIPVVSPFANSSDLYQYSNLVIIETNENVFADRIIDEVKSVYSNQKIYILAASGNQNSAYLKSGLEKSLRNPNIVVVNSATDIQTDTNMMTGQSAPIIAILANDKDSVAEEFANRMIAMSKNVQGIKSFSMHYAPVFDKKFDELSLASLVYTADIKINTEGTFEKEILADFKEKYCKTPSRFAVIGFDVVNDMLSRENKKGEIFKQMNKIQTQLASKFEFKRANGNGAYVNTGYRVVRLLPE